MTQEDTLKLLSEPFDKSVERALKKGGANLTYIPVSEVITRLNKVFGVTGWDYIVVDAYRDKSDQDHVLAHVRLTVHGTEGYDDNGNIQTGVATVRDAIGGVKIKRMSSGDPVDLGDEFKGAVSDALKKAAQSLGVAIYLARGEEALYLESQDGAISTEHFEKLRGVLNSQPVSVREAAMEYWFTVGDNKPFLNENITIDMLKIMLGWIKKNGESSDGSGD